MAVWADIDLSSIRQRRRFDAEYYQPEYLQIEEILHKQKTCTTLGQISKPLFSKGIFDIRAEEYVEEGIPFVRITNLRDGLIDTDGLVFLTPERSRKDYRTELSQYDIILSKTAYPAASLVQLPVCNVSQDTIAVKTNRDRMFNCFLVAFLNGKFGLPQMGRLFQGNIQSHLGIHEAKQILIPEPSREILEEIDGYFLSAIARLEESKSLYVSAQQLLESLLGLDKSILSHQLGFDAQISEILNARRMDAQHYRPSYEILFDAIGKAPEVRLLRDIVSFNQRGLQPRYQSDGPIAVVTSQHLGKQHIAYDQLEHTSEDAYIRSPRAHIQKNDVLVYTTGAYIGRTNIFLSDIQAMASNHVNILRIRPGYDPAYISLVMNSTVGLLQTEKFSAGSAQAEIYPWAFARFRIPLLLNDTMDEIGDKVRESFKARMEAKRLLKLVKYRVEEIIERGSRA